MPRIGRSAEFMRSIAMKGGLATKQRLKDDPTYYKEIASKGGRVTAEQRKMEKAARRAAKREAQANGQEPQATNPAPVVEIVEKPVEIVERKAKRASPSVLDRMWKGAEKS